MWIYIVRLIWSHYTQHNNQWPVHYHQLHQSAPADLKWHVAPCWEYLWGWIHQGPFEIQSALSTNGNRSFCLSVENVFNVWLSVPFTQRWHWHVCHLPPPLNLLVTFPLTRQLNSYLSCAAAFFKISQSSRNILSGSPSVWRGKKV